MFASAPMLALEGTRSNLHVDKLNCETRLRRHCLTSLTPRESRYLVFQCHWPRLRSQGPRQKIGCSALFSVQERRTLPRHKGPTRSGPATVESELLRRCESPSCHEQTGTKYLRHPDVLKRASQRIHEVRMISPNLARQAWCCVQRCLERDSLMLVSLLEPTLRRI